VTEPSAPETTAATAASPDDALHRVRARLAECRSRVEAFETGQARSNRALYEALENAWRLDRDLADDPKARRVLLRENGVRPARKGANPFTTVVKLAFAGADRARVNKYATVLAHAQETCPDGTSIADWLDHPERGIENSVKAWRAAHANRPRRPTPAEAEAAARARLGQVAGIDLERCEPLLRHLAAGDMFLAVGRKTDAGHLEVVHIPDDEAGRDLKRLLSRLGGDADFEARVAAAELEKLAMRRPSWDRSGLDALAGHVTRAELETLNARLDEAAFRRTRRRPLPGAAQGSGQTPGQGMPSGEDDRLSTELQEAVAALRTKLGSDAAFRRHVGRLFDRFDVEGRRWAELDPQLHAALSLVRGGTLSERVWDVLTRAVQRQFLEEALPIYEQMVDRWPAATAPSDHTLIRDFLLSLAEKRRVEGIPPAEALVPARRRLDAPGDAAGTILDDRAPAPPSFLLQAPARSA